jgi:hypothetical protein
MEISRACGSGPWPSGRSGLRGRYGSGGLGRGCPVWAGFGDAAEGDFEAGGSGLADVVGDLAAGVALAVVVVRAHVDWSPRTLMDRFPLCRICIRNVNKFLKPHRTQLSQAALFPDAVVIPLDVVEYRGPRLFGIQPQMLVDEFFLDRGVK